MNRPIIIVNPLSSGIELAPAFKKRGIPCIAITLPSFDWKGFGSTIRRTDFVEIIPDQANLVEILKPYNPIAIIPGTEEGVALAETLAATLTPHLANDPNKSLNRLHKALMQTALKDADVPCLKTLNTDSEKDAAMWIKDNSLLHSPLIIKPPISAGSDKVFHIPANGNWQKAFKHVLTEPSKLTGKRNDTVVLQEQAIGTEYAVGTVSANAKHYLTHLIKYNKRSSDDRKTLFDYVEFVAYNEEQHGELFKYTQKALDALGIRWGAAHNEVMLTNTGPRLIETGARLCGGPVTEFCREATGSSQADRLVEIYLDGDVTMKEYDFKKTVIPVFLKSPANGRLSNVEVFAEVSKLPTFLSEHIWFENGDKVPKTLDYLTSIGIVALLGERDTILSDYKKIRDMELKLRVV